MSTKFLLACNSSIVVLIVIQRFQTLFTKLIFNKIHNMFKDHIKFQKSK